MPKPGFKTITVTDYTHARLEKARLLLIGRDRWASRSMEDVIRVAHLPGEDPPQEVSENPTA